MIKTEIFVFPERTGLAPVPITGQIVIPEQNVTVMDRDNNLSRLQMVYPLFTGGLRSAMVRLGASGMAAARQALRRTELELIRTACTTSLWPSAQSWPAIDFMVLRPMSLASIQAA